MTPHQRKAASGGYQLTNDEIAAYKRDGYLILPEVVSEKEILPIEAIYQRFMNREVEGMGRDFCDMSGPYSRPFEEFNIINAVLPRNYAPELRNNLYEQRAESIARQLIGDDSTLDYDQLLSKRPGRDGAVFAWHQDLGYWPTGTPDTRTVTCSLALDHATLANGCLQVVPGSHREDQLRPHRPILTSNEGAREETHTLTIDLRSEDKLVPLEVKRGDITVHNERIIHGSGGNPTNGWRRTYVIAHRSEATVAYERSIGFTHSHNDTIQWVTHLEALEAGN